MMQAQKRSRRTAFSVQRLLAVLFSAQQFQHAALRTCADGLTNQLTVLEQQQGGATSSTMGLSIRQGPHQAAQKSSRTG